MLLFLVCSFVFLAAQSELICSHQPIVALVGDDFIQPCHLEPLISTSFETVVWTRPGLNSKYIHVHQDGQLESKSISLLLHSSVCGSADHWKPLLETLIQEDIFASFSRYRKKLPSNSVLVRAWG